MSDSTFGDLWRRLKVYCPELPIDLAKEMINTAYSRALASYTWAETRTTKAFYLVAPYTTGTVSVSNGSSTVTGASTVWTSSMVGMQLVIGGQAPLMDVSAIDTGAQTLTLASPFVGADVTNSAYSLQQIFLVMPTDFAWMQIFADLTGNTWWTLDYTHKQELLDTIDPRRITQNSTPLQLVQTSKSPFTSTLNQIRYELWPRPSGAKRYFMRYRARPALFTTDSEVPIDPIRGDVLREGAMVELKLWAGTETWKNPLYNPGDAQLHEQRFQERLARLWVEDQNVRPDATTYEEEWKRLVPVGDWWQSNTINIT